MEASDRTLVEFFSRCDPVELHTCMKLMESHFCESSRQIVQRYPEPEGVPQRQSAERQQVAEEMAGLLRWYASDALAYLVRMIAGKEGGVHYHEVVRDVAEQLNSRQAREARLKFPPVVGVDELEEIIVGTMFSQTIRGKSREEIAEMLREAGLDDDAATNAAKQFAPVLGVGVALPVVVRILGKKTVANIISQFAVAVTGKFIGKEAAVILAKRLMVKLSQKALARIISGVGWILIAVDLLLLMTSPAKRITIPTVATVSVLRVRERLVEPEREPEMVNSLVRLGRWLKKLFGKCLGRYKADG